MRPALAIALGLGACGAPDPGRPEVPTRELRARVEAIDPTLFERAPDTYARLALPEDVTQVFASVGPDGHATLAARDGRFFSMNAYGALAQIAPGDGVGATTLRGALERGPGELLGLTDEGALAVGGGWVQRVPLPRFLRAARARNPLGHKAIWSTPEGLFVSDAETWVRFDRGGEPVTDVIATLPLRDDGTTLELWTVHADGALQSVREIAGSLTWTDALSGLEGPVRAVARHRDHIYVARDEDLVRVTPAGALQRVRVPGQFRGPSAMAAGGGWLWLAWSGDAEAVVARYDGERRVEVLGRGGPLRAPTLHVDPIRGNLAVITDGAAATWVVAEATTGVIGLHDGAVVTSPELTLSVEPPAPWRVEAVEFSLDGARVARDEVAPYGWAEPGASRRFADLAFGEHTVAVSTRYRGAGESRITLRFRYDSPLGRAVTYTRDVAPIYRANCARCHSTGVARDLDGYERLRAQASAALDALNARRMPPDFSVDGATLRVFTGWIGSGLPRD